MDVERALVSKIITTGQLETALARKVRSDLFYDDECREVFDYLSDYATRYNVPPSLEAVKEDHPKFDIEHVQDPLDALIDRFIKLAKRRLANEMVVELAAACDDPERAENIDLEFLEVSKKLAMLVPSTEYARFNEMGKRIDEYEQRKAEGKQRGIPFGFPSLDAWTGGIKDHQLVTVAGFTGTGKSTLLKVCAFNAWSANYTPLYFSLEEDAAEIYERLDAMAAGIDYAKLRQLQLPEEQMKNWREYAEKLRDRDVERDIPVIDAGRNVTPDLVYAEMVRHKPSIVIIDYLSLMRSSSPSRQTSLWQSLTEITQDLKRIARTMKIPIFAAAQTNRSGGKDGAELDNIGYSLSVNQDSDIVIGLFTDEAMKEQNEMEIRLNKNRRGRLGKFTAIWNHEDAIFREKTELDRFGKSGSKEEDLRQADLREQKEAPRGRIIRPNPRNR